MFQVNPLNWPPGHVVDWSDAVERHAWLTELRIHICNIFVLGYERLSPRGPHGWTVKEIRANLEANKRSIAVLLSLAGAPFESWPKMSALPPMAWLVAPPEVVKGIRMPYQTQPQHLWTRQELTKFFGYVTNQLEDLAQLLEVAMPKEGDEQRRARWTVIRLRGLLDKLQVALGVAPPEQT